MHALASLIMKHFYFWFNVGVRASLRAPRLIPRAVKLTTTSTNPTGREVNNHVNLQCPSYEQPQGSNLRL